jgi:hypothetical protein
MAINMIGISFQFEGQMWRSPSMPKKQSKKPVKKSRVL